MAGSPIPVADSPDTVGASLPFYGNRELLELSKSGFVGKPLSSQLGDPRSEVWTGRTKDGSYVVGLFNRGSTPAVREIDYASALGIHEAAATRDLWDHQNLGALTKFRATLAAHESRMIRVAVVKK
jgi:alpha-glucosidase